MLIDKFRELNILLIGWSVSQWPLFRRRQNWQDGPLTYFLSGDILVRTSHYLPPVHNQCASFANSTADISCCFPSAENGFTLIHLYFLIFHPHHPPTNNHGYLSNSAQAKMQQQSLSLRGKKVTDSCGALGPAVLTPGPTLQCFGKAVWTRKTAVESWAHGW